MTDATVRFVALPVRMLAVGAAAPSLRLAAGDVAAAWGRSGGKGRAAVCAPDEDTLTLAVDAGLGALAAAGIAAAGVDGLWWGTTRPPFAEGPSHAVLAVRARALAPVRRRARRRLAARRHGRAARRGRRGRRRLGARRARRHLRRAACPASAPRFEARCGAGAAAVVLARRGRRSAVIGRRVTRTQPLLDRYRGDGESATRDLYDPRLFREEMFLPVVARGRRAPARRSTCSPGRSPTPTVGSARRVARQIGADQRRRRPRSTPRVGDTGAAAPLLGGIGALDAPGAVAIVGSGGGRTTGVDRRRPTRRCPGAAAVADVARRGRRRDLRRGAARPGQLDAGRRDDPDGRAARERAVRPRRRRDARSCSAAAASTAARSTPRRRSTRRASRAAATKLEPVPLARHGTVHTFVVNQTMPAPFVAPLPLVVRRPRRRRRGSCCRASATARTSRSATEVELVLRRYAHRAGRAGLRVEGPAARGDRPEEAP